MKDYATFIRIWLGQTVSGLGSQLTAFGLGVWVFSETKSVTAMAMIFMAAAIPGIVLSPFIGAMVDRVDRKKMLLLADAFAGVFGLFLLAVLLWSKLQLWQVYAIAAAGSIANTIMWPAMTATTSLLVPKEQLGRATGLTQFGEAGGYVLAPILGGFIFGFFGLKGLVAADIVSFVFAITMTLISRVPKPERTEEGREASQSMWSEIGYGFKFISQRPGMMILLGYFMSINLILPIAHTLVAPIVLSRWDAKTLGMLQSVAGLGMVVGTILMAAWGGPKHKVHGVWIFGLICLAGSLLLLLPLTPVVLGAAFFIMMVSTPIVNTCSQTIWQRKTPADVQGKVFAVRRMIAWFMTPLAFGLAGPLAEGVFEYQGKPRPWIHTFLGAEPGSGYRMMFVISGLLTLAVSLAIFALPRFRQVEDELPDATLNVADDGPQPELVPVG